MTMTTDDILRSLQRGFDTVKGGGRTLNRDDHLLDDLDLDSLDAIDVLSAAEQDLTAGAVNDVVDTMADKRTVGDLVDALAASLDRRQSRPNDAA